MTASAYPARFALWASIEGGEYDDRIDDTLRAPRFATVAEAVEYGTHNGPGWLQGLAAMYVEDAATSPAEVVAGWTRADGWSYPALDELLEV